MTSGLKAHHQEAIEKLVSTYQNDPAFPALIIGGSVAKGCARDDSDVDFLIVAHDKEYNERKARGDLFINRADLSNYPGGYVDGKIINERYLHEVADKGNEPSRAAFDGAFLGYSRLDGLEEVINNIAVYPESGHEERLKSFYCMAFMQHWLMTEADRHDNLYAKTRAASQLALYAGRLILAHNRVLYPYHKWLLHYLGKCVEKPMGLLRNIDSLLQNPNLQNTRTLFRSLQDFKDWGVTDLEAYTWFMEEVEWSWMSGTTPLEDL
ncbi:MAG: nucleotidyltransferase domain-containing protein [Roseivirga sp.]|nr:nucleotidyltransferase domain-containing protein [Roseivirga sp.]